MKTFKRLIILLIFYVFILAKEGMALMHVFVLEHLVSLQYRTAWLMFTKLGMDELFMAPHTFLCILTRSALVWSREGQKLMKEEPFFKKTSSSGRKATVTNRMRSIDLRRCGEKCCYFWLHSKVECFTHLWRRFGLN